MLSFIVYLIIGACIGLYTIKNLIEPMDHGADKIVMLVITLFWPIYALFGLLAKYYLPKK